MKYFNIDEFDSPDEPGSGQYMDDDFLEMLDRARDFAGVPFVINSGYRSKSHNLAVGGLKNSAHLDGFAADIRCNASRERMYIVGALLEAGFNRIGIGNGFIHVDNDPTKPEDCIWVYY
jgi:uncharacterized protein YcbK (DUF882 family)